MIIKNDHGSSVRFKYFPQIIAGLVIIVGAWYLIQKIDRNTAFTSDIYCDMEKVADDMFVSGNLQFGNSHTQSSEKARTGKYSSHITETKKYGARYDLKNIEAGDRVCASIWRWSPISNFGYLAFQGNEGSDFLKQNNIAEESDDEGWDKLSLCVDIPENMELSSLKIFPYSLSKHGYAFFDDLRINVIKSDSLEKSMKSIDVETAQLYIDTKGMRELANVRDEALRYGILINNDNYTSAKFIANDQEQKVKIRLKGDWTDHLEGMRWSYRIKTASDNAWNRMQTFSLQSPERRFFLKEWLFHDLLDHEGLLTTRYDFVWLKLNDNKKLLYAYEEHFDKQLPEYKHRREGVILKFSEDAAWEQRLRSKKTTGHHNTILLDAKHNSDIVPFKASRIEADSNLMKQFISGQELLYAYKHYTKPVDEIFDIEKMAKYYAILEVLNAYHSLVWHNQRFYYDPVSRLLEPIGYDGFIEEAEYSINAHACFGYYKSNLHVNDWGKYYNALFRNEAFAKAYAYYIDKYSDKAFIKKYLESIDDEMESRTKLLQSDFPSYDFDPKTILAKAKEIKASIPAYNNISLKAYSNSVQTGRKSISISNYHYLPLQIIGSGTEATNEPNNIVKIEKSVWSNHPNMTPEYTSIDIPSDHTCIYYQVLGLEEIYFTEINKWPAGNASISDAYTFNAIPLSKSDYTISEKAILIKAGNYSLSEPLIAADKELHIEPGTTIDLTNRAFILCRKPIQFNGTDISPITINSTDKTGQGLLVLKAQLKSKLAYVYFNDQDNLERKNYFMTGAISFYESPVDLYKCHFSNNLCEDALNIIRSDFTADGIHLNNTFSDGFDADFCQGTIKNSYSTHTGNDAFDFSGSVITIDNCYFKSIGDKGVSAGEEATININSATIDGAVIGVASKDLSQVTINDISVSNCNKAFAAYQKKPEYGPGKITIEKYTAENNKYLELKENNSEIIFPTSAQ